MTTLRSDADVIVLGSSLGGLVAATYLARAGLRVVLLEEQTHQKRPPLLREPFLLPGLGSDGRIRRVLRELAMPLLEQREIRQEPTSVQVILPNARIDMAPDMDPLAAELAAYGIASEGAAQAWLEAVAVQSEDTRRVLWEEPAPARQRPGASALNPSLSHTISRRLQKAVAPRALMPPRVQSALPAPPPGAGPFIAALLAAMAGLDPGDAAPAPALLIDGARTAAFRMPHSGTPFLDLFRRRFESLHGEVWPVEEFALVPDRNEVGVELARTRCLSRALVIAVPRDPLRRFLDNTGRAPRWLRRGLPVAETPARLFRAERANLPVGLGTRVIVADRTPGQIHWLSFSPDPTHAGVEWLVASGPGAGRISPERALGDLAPFSNAGIVSVDPGPAPSWDLDGSEVRFPTPDPAPALRHRVPVALVGAEAAPGLGPEGEILQARRVAVRLANRLRS